MTIAMLAQKWRDLAALLDPYSTGAAEAYRRAAAELDDARKGSADTVALKEAHAIGGYSIDHLQRLVRAGTIENFGTKGRIRIRRDDVPVRPGHSPLRAGAGERVFSDRRQVVASLGHRSEV